MLLTAVKQSSFFGFKNGSTQFREEAWEERLSNLHRERILRDEMKLRKV